MDQLTPLEINKRSDNYQKGIGVEKDERKAFELYLKADEIGNAAGTCNVGNCYYYGIGVERDFCKAFVYYKKSAEMGDATGTCNVGYCYNLGIGVETNSHKSWKYYQKAAKIGDIFALGVSYEKGVGVEKDEKKAFEYYLNFVEMENVKGIRAVGNCHQCGIGVKKNEHKAFEYFQKSADMGDILGTNAVGLCYDYGIGVKKDKNKAFEYYKKSADVGYDVGTYNVGICYEYGTGVIKDKCKAFEYYKKSAEMGYANGMYVIGEFYQKGLIVEKNIDIAFEWYLKSAITEHSSTNKKKEYFHWIPFEKFINVEEIGKGGFSAVFKTKYLNNHGSYEEVAIKLVKDSNKNREPFIKELKACHSLNQYLGISRDKKTNDYILVLSYAKYGSLSKSLADIFKFEWKIKLKILHDIISNLDRIHSKKYLHRDVHPGNILLKEGYEAYITDLGLSKPLDEEEQEERIHGVLPYIAPELFQKKLYTQASDIYSFGIIMVEIATGQRPFNNYKFDNDLALKICNGLRPDFGSGIPNCHIELAKQCIDSDPEKRPTSREIIIRLNKWLNIIRRNKWLNITRSDVKNKIKREFLANDENNKKLPIIKETLKNEYTSKPYNITEISKCLSKPKVSKTASIIEVPDDI